MDEALAPNGNTPVMLTKPERSDTVDLSDNALQVDISDALSERDKVKFTVHTKTNIREFKKQEFSVIRQHEEFVWLHDRYEENDEYAGYIIPPAPPRPDFESSREKLQKLGEGEGSMSADEFKKMKQELEAEYLATFKKTVAVHEMFLQRLVSHPVFKNDHNLHVFLEYEQDLSVRGKNRKEKIEDFWKSFTKSTDEILLSTTQKDTDDFFEKEKHFLVAFHEHLKDATYKADKMTRAHKDVADSMLKVASQLAQLSAMDVSPLEECFQKLIDYLEKSRKLESRVSSDEDLKLSDSFRYYVHETAAAKDLLYRRMRALADYEAANKALDKSRIKHKDIQAALDVADAEYAQQKACENFQVISDKARDDLRSLKSRRIITMKKSLVDMCDLEIKHAQGHITLLKSSLSLLQEE
ncbi:sorting nexin-6-like isoform X2 [Artemia franciscana]|uniref:Sorting nexin n=1 Tax=Artemia franciscana TaxID=6661 RepID=A0AA88KVS9_ARTSF|nr:hypothetical protein QYM36_015762 [Artemia franciscana]